MKVQADDPLAEPGCPQVDLSVLGPPIRQATPLSCGDLLEEADHVEDVHVDHVDVDRPLVTVVSHADGTGPAALLATGRTELEPPDVRGGRSGVQDCNRHDASVGRDG